MARRVLTLAEEGDLGHFSTKSSCATRQRRDEHRLHHQAVRPTTARIGGKRFGSGNTLTLMPASPTADRSFYGTFRYTVQGSKLSLYNGETFIKALGEVHTYRDTTNNCSTQSYIHPMCVGSATCSTENTCG